jgi:hypothetical protein
MKTTVHQTVNAPHHQGKNALLQAEVLAQCPFAHISSAISRLSPGDADLFRDAFQREEVCYADSWLYTLRSTRDDLGEPGYKFVGNETLMGIGYRHNTIYLVHPVGVGRFATMLDLCLTMRDRLQSSLILKKIDPALYNYLYATGLFRETGGELALLEEEAFPEHILQLEELYTPHTGKYSQSIPFIKKVRRFEKSAMKLQASPEISGVESNAGFYKLFGPDPDKYRSYRQMIREICAQGSCNSRYIAYAYHDEQATVQGLYIAEHLKDDHMGLYCAVSAKSFPGLTEWMDYNFFQRLFQQGVRFLHLGGSETRGVHDYVQKLLPATPPYCMRPLVMREGDIFLQQMPPQGPLYRVRGVALEDGWQTR